MAEENKSEAVAADTGEKLDKLLTALDSLSTKVHELHGRMDAIESEKEDRKDAGRRHRKDDDGEEGEAELKAELEGEEGAEATAEHIDDDDDEDDDDDDDDRKDARRKDARRKDARRKDARRKDDDDDDDDDDDRKDARRKDARRKDDDDDDDDDDRKDARRKDARRKDARRKDDEDDLDEPGLPRDIVADKRHRKDDDDDARHDSLSRRLAALEGRTRDLTDDDYAAMADAQSRADAVSRAYGETTPRPMQGESVLGYRRRLVGRFQSKSAKWGKVNLRTVTDPSLFGLIESEVMADALTAARTASDLPPTQLREIKTTSAAGHQQIEFVGRTSAWMRRSPSGLRAKLNLNHRG